MQRYMELVTTYRVIAGPE